MVILSRNKKRFLPHSMNISVNGILVNQSGELLVIKRPDTRTWAVPGGSLAVGESPERGMVRVVEEKTGFKILPVRLVRVQFVSQRTEGTLHLVFRCLMRGGAPNSSAESQKIGYVKANPLKLPMRASDKALIEGMLTTISGRPTWARYEMSGSEQLGRQLISPLRSLRQRREQVADWQLAAYVVILNELGEVLWIRQGDGTWMLPGGDAGAQEPPWETALRETLAQTGLSVELADLCGIYSEVNKQVKVFVFSAEIESSRLALNDRLIWQKPDTDQSNAVPGQSDYVTDALNPNRELTLFKNL